MTKLLQWLSAFFLYLALWLGLLTKQIPVALSESSSQLVLFSPILLVLAFGIYSIAVIAYRVSIFKDCPEAEAELRQQIKEAKKDLTKKGLKFD